MWPFGRIAGVDENPCCPVNVQRMRPSLLIAWSWCAFVPTYSVPSWPSAGDENAQLCTGTLHFISPFLIAYTCPSTEPTYTVPSPATAGDEKMFPSVSNVQSVLPSRENA